MKIVTWGFPSVKRVVKIYWDSLDRLYTNRLASPSPQWENCLQFKCLCGNVFAHFNAPAIKLHIIISFMPHQYAELRTICVNSNSTFVAGTVLEPSFRLETTRMIMVVFINLSIALGWQRLWFFHFMRLHYRPLRRRTENYSRPLGCPHQMNHDSPFTLVIEHPEVWSKTLGKNHSDCLMRNQ